MIAAFFDIDGTLYREGLISELFKKLVKAEIIDNERWYNEVRPEYQKYDKRQGNYDNYLLKMAEIYTQEIKGLHRSQVEFIARLVIEQKGDRVYRFTRDQIKWHRENGHKLITISGSPVELVRAMAQKHGFDDFRAASYEIDEHGQYSGSVTPMWDSESKRKAIKEFVENYDIDLSKSYSYGDTTGDYAMFEAVGNPICVNPTRELLYKVLENPELKSRIRVIVERKDMIYDLKPETIDLDVTKG